MPKSINNQRFTFKFLSFNYSNYFQSSFLPMENEALDSFSQLFLISSPCLFLYLSKYIA